MDCDSLNMEEFRTARYTGGCSAIFEASDTAIDQSLTNTECCPPASLDCFYREKKGDREDNDPKFGPRFRFDHVEASLLILYYVLYSLVHRNLKAEKKRYPLVRCFKVIKILDYILS